MRVLSVEGTAWMASAAVFDTASGEVTEFSDAYAPDSGGIHPREAAEHMSEAIPTVVGEALAHARDTPPGNADGAAVSDSATANDTQLADETTADTSGTAATSETAAVDAVAFSRGPGLGPCLRITGTAARALAAELAVPLVGVNHMLAHLEIGRHRSGFQRPVCLNASGANAHLLGFHAGRYRVLGETMDTGVGNTLDKFARSLGWDHPGGPKVEQAARDGSYHELPYVVKGMDFSFAGLASAAEQAVESGAAVPDVCAGLQEHVFGMLTEVSERALSLTGADELVVGGGVAQNQRLQEMLRSMCADRGASLFVPESRFLRDNAGMIAVLGAKMAAAGDTVAIEQSAVDPGFRPDQVAVTWRDEPSVAHSSGLRSGDSADGSTDADRLTSAGTDDGSSVRGAEATVRIEDGAVVKRRPVKSYRHPALDDRLRRERTTIEARLLAAARKQGVPTPVVRDVDTETGTLRLSYVGDRELAAAPTVSRVRQVGRLLARLHAAGIAHGDLTTRNVRITDNEPAERAANGEPVGAESDDESPGDGTRDDGTADDETPAVFLIDFGLGFYADHVEELAMDLHVFEGSLQGTVTDADRLTAAFEAGYRAERGSVGIEPDVAGSETPLDRLQQIQQRGRYR